MDLSSLPQNTPVIAAMLAGAYLLGSVSSAIIVCHLFGLPDPRTEGSNNPGATNVMRLGGKPAALLTLAGDVLKGVLPVMLALHLALPLAWVAAVGFAAFFGHLLPVFFRFQGGKGVATAFGVIFALHWPTGLATGAVWLTLFAVTRISSIASMTAFLVMPALFALWLPAAQWPMIIMSALMIARHHQNIRKLISGEELGFRKAPGDKSGGE